MLRVPLLFAIATAALVLLGSAPQSAEAATFVVDRFDDPSPNTPRCTSAPNDCSLREAILEANATPGTADQITLRSGRYNLTRTGAGAGAGDLDITGPVTIVGATRQAIIDANDIDRVFEIACAASCDVEFNRLQIRDGLLTGKDGTGGGIDNGQNSTLLLRNSVVSSNRTVGTALYGAGIFNAGSLTVLKSTVKFNVGEGEQAYGGGIFNDGAEIAVVDSTVSNNRAQTGGGLYLRGGTAFINRSAIVSNTATDFDGGGVYSLRPLVLRNSTLSGNSTASDGGGLYSAGEGPITIENVTIKGNSSLGGGDGIFHDSDLVGSLTYKHTIFDNVDDPPGEDLNCGAFYATTLKSLGKNISTDNSCPRDTTSDFPNFSDPKLGPLRDNGGLSVTHAPQPGSPALNGGFVDSVECAGPRDQRGQLRPVGTYCDIGAFEAQVCFPGEGELYYLGFETISGTRRPDDIEGTPGRDVIMTFEGNDTISGLGGNDRICGGSGDDTLNGDGGTDSLDGGSGTDTCNGGPPDTDEPRVSCEAGIP
ncbi:MAG: choice-of-anchor Q domain-containing protein [Dehalococcoidia bacterium]